MSNCRQKYSTEISDDIKDIAGVGRTSAKAIKANQILLPVGGLSGDNKSLSSKANTLEWAKQIKKKVDEKYNAKAFGSLVDLDTTLRNGTVINITITKRILDAYEAKNGDKPSSIIMYQTDDNKVNYKLKVVKALESDKVRQPKASIIQGFYNDLVKQGVSKEQLEFVKDIYKENMTKADLITSLLAEMSFAVEVETTKNRVRTEFDEEYGKSKNRNSDYYKNLTVPGGNKYTENEIKTPNIIPGIKGHAQFSTDQGIGWFRSDDQSNEIKHTIFKGFIGTPKTGLHPADIDDLKEDLEDGKITLSRFTELTGLTRTNEKPNTLNTKTRRILEVQSDLFQKGRDKEDLLTKQDPYKDEQWLAGLNPYNSPEAQKLGKYAVFNTNGDIHDFYDTLEEAEKSLEKSYGVINLKDKESNTKNKFLQLLNKDASWVSFFVKSIIQDSAKKGYEKVLFPTGETAAKVEGHQTLANEILRIDKELKNLKPEGEWTIGEAKHAFKISDRFIDSYNEERLKLQEEYKDKFILGLVSRNPEGKIYGTNFKEGKDQEFYNTKEEALEASKTKSTFQYEKKKQELEKRKSELKSQGIEKLKPIEAFYEIKVTNILKKAGYNPKVVTDEYGNTWNEITIDPTRDISNIYFQTTNKSTVDKKKELIDSLYTNLEDYIKVNNIKVEFLDSLKDEFGHDPTAIYDQIAQVIKINKGRERADTLPEELAHHITTALGDDHVLIKRAMNLVGRLDYKNLLGQDYVDLYKGDVKLLKHEYLGKLIAKNIVSRELPEELESNPFSSEIPVGKLLWDTINNIVKAFIKLFKPNTNIENELESIVDELSGMMLSTKKINSSPLSDPIQLFQIDSKNKVPKEFRSQYVYYKHLVKKLDRQKQKELTKEEPDKVKIEELDEKISNINNSLKELIESGNKQLLINLARTTLDEIEKELNKLHEVKKAGGNPKYENIENANKVLSILSSFTPVKTDVGILQERLKEHIKDFVIQHVNKYSTDKINDINLEAEEKDILASEGGVGTLSDVTNKLGRTIGFTVKDSQAAIERDNKKSYNELTKEVDLLQKYNARNNISENDAFKIFIQEDRGTTVLTREYTSEFYKAISDSYLKDKYTEEQGLALRKAIASFDFENRQWIPKDAKYKNKSFEKIKTTPELKRFYDYFKKTIDDIKEELPVNLAENFIPNVIESSMLDILKSDGALMSNLKDGINNMFDLWDVKENEKDNSFIKDEHLFNDTVPLRYIAKLDPSKKTKDLGTALLKFMYFANSYKHMNEILPKTRLMQEVLKEQSFIKRTKNRVAVEGEKTNLYKMTEAFINMQVKGQMKKDTENYAPYIDFGLKYTSLLRIGLNPFNAITNVVIGNIGNVVEAAGGRAYNWKEYTKARKIYFEQNFSKDSKLNKLVERYNPLMELEDYENIEKIKTSNLSKRTADKVENSMYSFQKAGEKLLQTSTMIASMLHDKITIKDGTKISLWEAFDEKGEWKKDLVGYELTDDMIFRTTNKIQRINQMIHGRYSSKDAAAWSQYALFRAAFQFKKWIPSAIESRLGEKRFDERLGYEIEGRYWTYIKLIRNISARLQNNVDKIEKYKFDETDLYNMRKNVTEVIIMMSTWLMFLALGWDDKDKRRKEGWYKFMLDQLDRASGDMLFWYNPAELNRTASNPLPLLKTTKDVLALIPNLPYAFGVEDVLWLDKSSEYKKGRKKGENKFLSSLIDVTPAAKPIADVFRTWNKEPYQARHKQ